MSEQDADAMLDEAGAQISQLMADEGLEDAVEEESEVEDVYVDADEEADAEEEVVAEEAADEEIDAEDAAEIARARKAGWRPKEEYKGDPKLWKDYKEFNKVGDQIASKLNNKIDSLSAQNEKQAEMIKQLVKAQGQVFKQAQEDAIKKLRAQRREAIEMGDADAVEELDDRIAEESSKKVDLDVEDEPAQPQRDPEVEEFIQNESSWFDPTCRRNPDMSQYAIQMEMMERQLNPNADSGEIMAAVKAAVVRRFPGRVPGAEKAKPKVKQLKHSPVEGGTTPVKSARISRLSELPAEAQKIAREFDKAGIMDIKTYIKQFNEGL